MQVELCLISVADPETEIFLAPFTAMFLSHNDIKYSLPKILYHGVISGTITENLRISLNGDWHSSILMSRCKEQCPTVSLTNFTTVPLVPFC